MTAQLRVIDGGIADRNTVAGLDHAMQELAQARKAEPRPAREQTHLALVPAPKPQRSPCACGRPSCPAQSLWLDYMRLRAAWIVDQRQEYTPVALAHRAYDIASAACFARICPHLKRPDCDIVTVTGVDLDSGEIGDIRYIVRTAGSEVVVTPLPGQPITAVGAGAVTMTYRLILGDCIEGSPRAYRPRRLGHGTRCSCGLPLVRGCRPMTTALDNAPFTERNT